MEGRASMNASDEVAAMVEWYGWLAVWQAKSL